MNLKSAFFSFICFIFVSQLSAQVTTTTTVSANSTDISLNLDLEAVSSAFGESKDLEDFEKKLNDPEAKISNLDLNEDGDVDYLRVVEVSEKQTHVITIQAVIAKDQFQDVATIDVEKSGEDTTVLVTGDEYIYGANYYIAPFYNVVPPIYGWFWGPYYNPWMSPWYWGFYPPYFRPWRPFPPHIYHNNVHVHINNHNRYHRDHLKRNHRAKHLQKSVSHKDLQKKFPNKSFKDRNSGMTNKRDFNSSTKARYNQSNFNKIDRSRSTRPISRPTYSRPMTRPAGRFSGFRR
ncbi:hypothetical protein ACJOV8_002860 [Formosa sp. 3Alg 14/1]|uniref:hypothetical protein n=1 Tax=Formosa sp. 3Alg 14/1 TaxID=3382190 RepID=UPI0039BE4B1E